MTRFDFCMSGDLFDEYTNQIRLTGEVVTFDQNYLFLDTEGDTVSMELDRYVIQLPMSASLFEYLSKHPMNHVCINAVFVGQDIQIYYLSRNTDASKTNRARVAGIVASLEVDPSLRHLQCGIMKSNRQQIIRYSWNYSDSAPDIHVGGMISSEGMLFHGAGEYYIQPRGFYFFDEQGNSVCHPRMGGANV